MADNETFFVRNARPNTIVVRYGELRIPLAHRGGLGKDLRSSPGDSTSLPADAKNDPTISRWLRDGTLEEITRDQFMTLGKRKVDVLPNEYLKRSQMRDTRFKGELPMVPDNEGDRTGRPSQVEDKDVHATIQKNTRPEWGGELMTTAEELETFEAEQDAQGYPSKHREADRRKQMGY